jgi:hypothetical protein
MMWPGRGGRNCPRIWRLWITSLFWPSVERWQRKLRETGPVGLADVVAQVSDSIHLRRSCQISLTERVPSLSPTARSKLPASLPDNGDKPIRRRVSPSHACGAAATR